MDARKQANAYDKVQALGIIPSGQYQDYRILFTNIVFGIASLKQNIFNEAKNSDGVVELKYLLHTRLKENDMRFPFRVDIYEKSIRGKGGFGAVHRIVGKIKLNQQLEIKYKAIDNAALKLKSCPETYEETEQEDNILKRLPHLKMTAHTIALGSDIPIIRMRFFDGSNLGELIKDGIVEQLCTTEKLIWAVGILKALNDQFHRNGIIHRDLSLANILIDTTDTANPVINIIDTDTCRFENKNDHQRMGTYEFRAPEGFMPKGVQTKQSDHYSIILCIMALLANRPPYITPAKECGESERERRSIGHALICEKCNHHDWFMPFMESMLAHLKREITSCEAIDDIVSYFSTILTSSETCRPPLSHSIAFFNEILLKHQLKYVDGDDQDDFKEAYATGVIARVQVEQADNLDTIIQIILNELYTINDQPICVNEFTQTLGIPLLRQVAQSRTEISHFLKNELAFYKLTQDLWYENQIATSAKARKYLDKISERLSRYQQLAVNTHWTLDLLHELNSKNKVTFEKLERCMPSLYYRQGLDEVFNGRAWATMETAKLNSKLFTWLDSDNLATYSEQIKIFIAHYKLLFEFKKLGVNNQVMQLAAKIQAPSIPAFIEEMQALKLRIPRINNSDNLKLFSQSTTPKYYSIIDNIINHIKPSQTLRNA